MICLRCGRENESDANFCEHCGTRLLRVCPECGVKNISGKKFCPNCGADLKQYYFISNARDQDKVRDEIKDVDLDAELELYKNELKGGAIIITCPHCGVKNRIPKKKMNSNPQCGKCGESLK